jgi:hypothetical protein
MSTYFFMGRNDQNVSGVSWKLWRIVRSSTSVTVWWGPAHVVKRKIVAKGRLQSKTWPSFRTQREALAFRRARVQEKLREGYQARQAALRVK